MRTLKVAVATVLVTLFAVLSACTHGPAPIRASDVSEVMILPPSGIGDILLEPHFALHPKFTSRIFPMAAIQDAIPDPLPPPHEHTGCSLGNRLLFTLKNGTQLIYESCDTTAEMKAFDSAMGIKYIELLRAKDLLK